MNRYIFTAILAALSAFQHATGTTAAEDREWATRVTCELQTAGTQSLPTLQMSQGATPLFSFDQCRAGMEVNALTNFNAVFVLGPTATSDYFVAVTNYTTSGNGYLVQLPTVGTNTTGVAAWWYTVYFESGGHRYWTGSGRATITETTSTDDGLTWQAMTTSVAAASNTVLITANGVLIAANSVTGALHTTAIDANSVTGALNTAAIAENTVNIASLSNTVAGISMPTSVSFATNSTYAVTVTGAQSNDLVNVQTQATANSVTGAAHTVSIAALEGHTNLINSALQPAALGAYVPYTGGTSNVNLGAYNITAHDAIFDSLHIANSSGNITGAGNIYVTPNSGAGTIYLSAATINFGSGTLTGTGLLSAGNLSGTNTGDQVGAITNNGDAALNNIYALTYATNTYNYTNIIVISDNLYGNPEAFGIYTNSIPNAYGWQIDYDGIGPNPLWLKHYPSLRSYPFNYVNLPTEATGQGGAPATGEVFVAWGTYQQVDTTSNLVVAAGAVAGSGAALTGITPAQIGAIASAISSTPTGTVSAVTVQGAINELASESVPYTGGASNVDLGNHNFTVATNTLFVDSANNRIGVGTTNTTDLLTIKQQAGVLSAIKVFNDDGTKYFTMNINNSNGSVYFTGIPSPFYFSPGVAVLDNAYFKLGGGNPNVKMAYNSTSDNLEFYNSKDAGGRYEIFSVPMNEDVVNFPDKSITTDHDLTVAGNFYLGSEIGGARAYLRTDGTNLFYVNVNSVTNAITSN